ncbi:hypothetical protein JCM10908_004859 [Rhodotorula pacifica]|uniref:uncharacterized protein n=1 Tax=Rhodotorula pacifica TaxID=1495444 RepID=UPI00316BDCE9
MAKRSIPVAFDVLGTCFDIRGAVAPLRSSFPTLQAESATAVVDDWFHSAQRDFTYLSMNGAYRPIAEVLKATLPRVLAMQNVIPPPANPSQPADQYSDSLQPVLSALKSLPARPSLSGASTLLLENGFRCMAATNGALESTRGLFTNALGEEVAQKWEYYSCDEDRVAKPAPSVYAVIRKRLGLEKEDEECWFVASHTWDLFAAKKAGFKTAFVTYEEHFVLDEVFGRPDIVARDLEEAAKQIIERSGRS